MANQVCLYFQVHQPNRLKHYSFFEIGKDHFYENDDLNKEILFKVSEKCYLPANDMLYDLIQQGKGKFKVSFSLSGTLMEQFEYFHPRVLASFRRLVDTGCVEILAETYYHSLAGVFSKTEFKSQIKKHRDKVVELFGVEPVTFRNTELIYNNELGQYIEDLGYETVLTEGVLDKLAGKHPNQVFKVPNSKSIKVLTRNLKLTDDIAYRFTNQAWEHYPLDEKKYVQWVKDEPGELVNLFMDYETIGEHNWADSGIFHFWWSFVNEFINSGGSFILPQEAKPKKNVPLYDVHEKYISWADTEKDLSAWKENYMQVEALDKVYGLEKYLVQCDDKDLWHIWRKLQTSDHFYYMSTKQSNDGAVHSYFSPYATPYDAYIYFMNALTDLEVTLEKKGVEIIFD